MPEPFPASAPGPLGVGGHHGAHVLSCAAMVCMLILML